MRAFFSHSFRNRLFAAFLVVSLVPVLICSALLLQAFRLRLTANALRESESYLGNVTQAVDTLYSGLVATVDALGRNPQLTANLAYASRTDTRVYSDFFTAVGELRTYARFDLYDAEGNWRYSTHQAPVQLRLPTGWGILQAAASGGGPVFTATEDATALQGPLLQCAAALNTRNGRRAGYLVVSVYQSHFLHLLEGRYGAQNDLLVLSRYWRPVYASQAVLSATLAHDLRARVLDGQPPADAADDFLYTVERHAPTGLYLVLRRPKMFTEGTMRVLYTVSLMGVLVCVAVSILMSLQVSRRMFSPIGMLHRAIGEVEHNNLDAYISHRQTDELGQLAERFNGMLVALKRNQEALVENQRELNQAQIRMLQAQLNPHFLCNTLDTMKWISKINKVPEVALMATDLADILRLCISPEEFLPLQREAELAERYAEIQNIRLQGTFRLELSLPPALRDCPVPKMMLQPMVENAILHGLESVPRGLVRVEADEPSPGLLRLRVSDNGRGFPPHLLGPYAARTADAAHHRLGLYNVDTILRKYYGDGFGLHLDNSADGGAVVTALLPIRWEEEPPC